MKIPSNKVSDDLKALPWKDELKSNLKKKTKENPGSILQTHT